MNSFHITHSSGILIVDFEQINASSICMTSNKYFNVLLFTYLIHFLSVFPFYTPRKHLKVFSFLVFFQGVQNGNIGQEWVNLFHANVPFLYPLKTSENLWFFYIFREYRNRTLTWKGLIYTHQSIFLFSIWTIQPVFNEVGEKWVKTSFKHLWSNVHNFCVQNIFTFLVQLLLQLQYLLSLEWAIARYEIISKVLMCYWSSKYSGIPLKLKKCPRRLLDIFIFLKGYLFKMDVYTMTRLSAEKKTKKFQKRIDKSAVNVFTSACIWSFRPLILDIIAIIGLSNKHFVTWFPCVIRFWSFQARSNDYTHAKQHHLVMISLIQPPCRSSFSEVSCKKGALKNFAKFTGKHLCQSLFLNKVAGPKNTFSYRTPPAAASGVSLFHAQAEQTYFDERVDVAW